MACSCSLVGIARHRPRYRTGPQRYNLSHSSTVWTHSSHTSHSGTVSHVSQEITGKTQQPPFCGERAHCAVTARRNASPCPLPLGPAPGGGRSGHGRPQGWKTIPLRMRRPPFPVTLYAPGTLLPDWNGFLRILSFVPFRSDVTLTIR